MNAAAVAAKFLPATLLGRLLAALLLAVGVTLALIVVLIVQDRRELYMHVGGVGESSRRIAEITRSLETMDRESRAAESRRLNADRTMRVAPVRYEGTLRRDELARIQRSFRAELRGQLGSHYEVHVTRARSSTKDFIRLVERRIEAGVLDVTVTLPDEDDLVFRVPAPRPNPPVPWPLFVQLGVLTLVLAAVLCAVTGSITRPLSNLARAANAVGRSVRHPPLREEGVREIREATRAFNTMQDRLLRYLDSRSGVLAAMSHDLRTPLTRLRLRVESVDDVELRARFVADLEEMEALVRGALGLFKGLDDDETFDRIDLNALLARLAAEYAEVGAGVSLEEGRARDLVNAKPLALKRCLTNLIDNAVKFGQRALIRVEDGAALIVSIMDEGPGIPEESLEQVFEPFCRLESSRSRGTGGAGLGLSIARDVAQAHGGTLTLRNRPEGGLIAQLRLPRK